MISAGIPSGSGEILATGIFLPGRNLAGIPARFSPGREIPGGQNLARTLPRISPRFSPRSKNPGGQNLGAILPRFSPRFSLGGNYPGGQNLAGILPRISPRFSLRSKFTVAKISVRVVYQFVFLAIQLFLNFKHCTIFTRILDLNRCHHLSLAFSKHIY